MAETIESLAATVTKLEKKIEEVRVNEITGGDRTEKKADMAVGLIKDIKHSLEMLTKRVTDLEKAKKK